MEPLEGSVVTKENQKTEKMKILKTGTSGCGFSQLQQMKIDAIEGDFIKE